MNDQKKKVITRTFLFPDNTEVVKKLWLDYLVRCNDKMDELYGVHPYDPKEALEHDMQQIAKFQPPYGQLILAIYGDNVVGLGSLKCFNPDIGETKRMFVDSSKRQIGFSYRR